MADSAGSQSSGVALLNGATVPAERIISTMGTLRYLLGLGPRGQQLLRCLFQICDQRLADAGHPQAVQRLVKLELLAENGTAPDDIRDIVLSAVVRKSEGPPLLTLRDPYLESDKNAAILDSVLRQVYQGMGLGNLYPTHNAKPDSGRRPR